MCVDFEGMGLAWFGGSSAGKMQNWRRSCGVRLFGAEEGALFDRHGVFEDVGFTFW